jgi:hypothetical protein
MTAADDELTALRALCGPYLAQLATLAGSSPGTPLPPGAATEVAESTRAVLAQAGQAVTAAAADRQATTGEFLVALLNRLEIAADGAVTAAREGYGATLRACLREFDALTSTLWAVHEAVLSRPQSSRPDGRTPAGGKQAEVRRRAPRRVHARGGSRDSGIPYGLRGSRVRRSR